jgi:hypothetical protein
MHADRQRSCWLAMAKHWIRQHVPHGGIACHNSSALTVIQEVVRTANKQKMLLNEQLTV